MLDLRERQKGGFRAFAQRAAQVCADRDAAEDADATRADRVPATDTADAPVYGPRLVKDTPAR
jgi:hypothetical protein